MSEGLSGTYPIFLKDQKIGKLEISCDGLYTVFSAECKYMDGFWRLYVSGSENVFCLGIMEPRKNNLILKRKLTKNQLKAFPETILRTEISQEKVELKSSPPLTSNNLPNNEVFPPLNDENILKVLNKIPPTSIINYEWFPCPCVCSLFSDLERKELFGKLYGVLRSKKGKGHLLAIPIKQTEKLKKSGFNFIDKITYNNREYLIYHL